MAVQVGDRGAGRGLELGDRADDADLRTVNIGPDRDRRAPEAGARDRPVVRALEPVVEALVLDVGGHPVGRRVVGQQLGLDLLDLCCFGFCFGFCFWVFCWVFLLLVGV